MKKNTYIKFKAPKFERNSRPDGILNRIFKKVIVGILSTIIPKANPDFDNQIDLVETWLVELDSETEIPEREMGLDKNGRVILKMPYKDNYGYWTDNNLLLKDFKEHFSCSEINIENFENYWNEYEHKF